MQTLMTRLILRQWTGSPMRSMSALLAEVSPYTIPIDYGPVFEHPSGIERLFK